MLSSTEELVAVLARVAARDAAAFEILYRATSPKLYGVILRILVRRSVADEILQEVYVKIWERAGDYDASKASPITWMATIARNRALDEVRRVSVARTDSWPEHLDVAGDDAHPLESTERSQALVKLMTCLDGLDPEKRRMVLLAYYHGMSRETLGQRFNRPVPTVKTWLHRSLTQLRQCMS